MPLLVRGPGPCPLVLDMTQQRLDWSTCPQGETVYMFPLVIDLGADYSCDTAELVSERRLAVSLPRLGDRVEVGTPFAVR